MSTSPWDFLRERIGDYESVNSWPLGMVKLMCKFAAEYADFWHAEKQASSDEYNAAVERAMRKEEI